MAVGYRVSVIAGLKQRTGRTIDEWVALVTREKLPDAKGRGKWLRDRHQLGATTISVINGAIDDTPTDYDPDALEAQLFSGSKAAMIPVYHAILAVADSLGADVTITPTSTMVPIRRKHVVASVRPLASRVDLGLALGRSAEVLPARLIDTGGKAKGDRITHAIQLITPSDVDAFVSRWLRRAYELDA